MRHSALAFSSVIAGLVAAAPSPQDYGHPLGTSANTQPQPVKTLCIPRDLGSDHPNNFPLCTGGANEQPLAVCNSSTTASPNVAQNKDVPCISNATVPVEQTNSTESVPPGSVASNGQSYRNRLRRRDDTPSATPEQLDDPNNWKPAVLPEDEDPSYYQNQPKPQPDKSSNTTDSSGNPIGQQQGNQTAAQIQQQADNTTATEGADKLRELTAPINSTNNTPVNGTNSTGVPINQSQGNQTAAQTDQQANSTTATEGADKLRELTAPINSTNNTPVNDTNSKAVPIDQSRGNPTDVRVPISGNRFRV